MKIIDIIILILAYPVCAGSILLAIDLNAKAEEMKKARMLKSKKP